MQNSQQSFGEWMQRNLLTVVMLIITSSASFVLGQARGDAVQNEKLDNLTSEVKKIQDNKVSREEFVQFVKSMDSQLSMMNDNLRGIRDDLRKR